MSITGVRTMTPEQMKMLSEIFRFVLKEIRTNEDKEKLAPGEVGISYTEGAFYVRDPHTGELFSPNSVQNIQQILEKYDPVTGKLNADSVNYIRFYSSMNQLNRIGGISLSADSAIRQMANPSILVASVEYKNYDRLGFPSARGVFTVIKLNEMFVQASFSDLEHNIMYDGVYDPDRHFLNGWIKRGMNFGDNIAHTISGGQIIHVVYRQPYSDLSTITVRVTEDISPSAVVSVDGKTAHPLVDMTGTPNDEVIPANTIIVLVYDDKRKVWMYCNPSVSDIQSIINQILGDRIDGTQENIKQIEVTPLQTGYLYTVSEDGINTILVGNFDSKTSVLTINYGQTVLRQGIDYDLTAPNKVVIKNGITLKKGEQLYFTILSLKVTVQM